MITKNTFVVTIITVLGILFGTSCEKKILHETNQVAPTSKSTFIPLQSAIEHLDSFLDAISFRTRSGCSPQYDIASISIISTRNKINTRASGFEDIPDTLLYLVNFSSGEGFAILAADSRISSPVICLTESGTISQEEFDSALLCFQDNAYKSIDPQYKEMGMRIISSLILSSALSSINSAQKGRGDGGEGGNEDETDEMDDDFFLPYDPGSSSGGSPQPRSFGPYLKTKWTQTMDPFNRYTPNHYPAGCSCVALAQLLVADKQIDSIVFNGVSCKFDEMETVHDYTNHLSSYNGSDTAKEQVANFMVALGSSNYLNLEYSSSGSHPNDLLDTGTPLRDAMQQLGYNASKEYGLFSFTNSMKQTTYDLLKEGHPVLAQASTSSGDGHVWVIDGYEFIPSMSFTGQYFHINWGWHGERDGYYNMGVFNTINGQFANSTYDNLSQLNMGDNMNFTWDFAIIDY